MSMIEIETVRCGAGWFRLPERGLVAVRGRDRVRFLNGQLTQDIEALEAAGIGAGTYAFLLTPQGRIVSDLHVAVREDAIWLECAAARVAAVIERLDRFLVADDVTLQDEGAAWARFGIEGPAAHAVLPESAGLGADDARAAQVAGHSIWIASFGWSAYPALQLWVAREHAEAVERAVLESGRPHGLVPASSETLRVLRVEAGVAAAPELDEDTLPAETGLLERAVSFDKGCYTGQEVVARMASRNRVAHRLVGLVRPRGAAAAFRSGASLSVAGRRIGEITSVADSPLHGPIALAFVRTVHAEPGTSVEIEHDERAAEVAALPFRTTSA